MGSKLFIQGGVDFIGRGDDPGANALNSYRDRNIVDGEDEQFITGNIETSTKSFISLNYYLSSMASIKMIATNEPMIELGLALDW